MQSTNELPTEPTAATAAVRVIEAVAPQRRVAHAEVNGEVHSQADEEHAKREGNQVQVPDGGRGEGRGPDQPDQKRGDGGGDQAQRTERQVEHEDHEEEAESATHADVPGEPQHLFVVEGRVPGDAHNHALLRRESQIPGGIPDRLEGSPRRQQRVEVEDGLHHQHPAGRDVERGSAEQELLPGDRQRELVEGTRGGVAHAVENRGPLLAIRVLERDALQTRAHQHGDVGDARVALQLGDQRLDQRHVVGEIVEVIDAAIEEPVALEEVATSGNEDVGESIGLPAQIRSQLAGGVPGQLRSLRVDHHQQGVVQDRKELGKLVQGPARRDVFREQPHVVGVDAQERDRISEQQQCEDQDRTHDPGCVREHQADPAGEDPPDQLIESSLHRPFPFRLR